VTRDPIVVASWAGTVTFVALGVAAVFVEALAGVAVAADIALFAAGTVAFLFAYGIAIARSRTDAIGIGGLYFLAGDVAPPAVRRHLTAALAVQVAAALTVASLRPFTSAAFAILVPMYGLGLAGLWGARHGRFGPRSAQS
jgi:hypothetical protein